VVYGDAILCAGVAAELVPVTSLDGVVPGVSTDATGRAQVAYLEAAVADALAGRLDALVTAPIHKASCLAAGFGFPGHTEFLQARFGADAVTMMFAGPRLRVSLATIHHALADVPRVLSAEAIAVAIVHTAEALARDFGVDRPRIAVAGLNPHAGEAGHFGDDETRVIAPAIEVARARLAAAGLAAELFGPRVPDAVFRDHLEGRFDAVVAMYHDQGLIPVKVVDFEEAVNVTLGLPIVRTSPDHGVAYDIAGKKRARPTSFAAALRLARELTARRRAVI
jgi:4-hydroxythreonine-4-phosphate dehydrogenase